MIISWYVGAIDNLFDLQDRESDDDREVLDTGGVPAKGTPTVKSVHIVLEDPCRTQSRVQNDYGAKEDVTVTRSLRRGGGCRQDGLGTSAVLEPKSQVKALGLEEEI